MITLNVKRLLVYMGKCVVGALLVFLLSWWLHYGDYIWCLISVMLVLSPDGTDAVSLAMSRIKANLVGAGAGLLMLLVHPVPVVMVAGGIGITVAVCTLLKLEPSTRTALAATIIVTLHEAGRHVWDTALERILSVLAGCLLGLLITFIFHSRFTNRPAEAPAHHEA
ncbi:FUSC family protein [Chitinophaga japonensis]|uniref:Fusaric acid resistance family protein n=1 Tax=Chitinophaga japonensis TaxID=104662 RepID=A0A562T0F5_CHIJA|nr:FUSC family protein [Chitinophaga japonensis]TWI86490.1 fusaric acid resistance family protein [Chitinophaga japonensis]